MDKTLKKVKTLIVDDESMARRTIRDLLRSDADIEVIGECDTGLEAVKFIQKEPPDLLFLDIQMPGLNGFEVLSKIDLARVPAIIFVTAFDKYALKAFEVHAVDYLLKPFSDQRFEAALKQAKSHLELKDVNKLSQNLLSLIEAYSGKATTVAKPKRFLTRFMIKSGGRSAFVKAEEVDWIAADDYYIKLHVGGKSHLLRMSMGELEEKLDPEKFLRIHRSTIINFDRVKELHQNPNGDSVVVLKDGTELKLSRSRREHLERFLAI